MIVHYSELNIRTLSRIQGADLEHGRHLTCVLGAISKDWYKFGRMLNFSHEQLLSVHHHSGPDPEECCRAVFSKWIDDGGSSVYPVTWESIFRLLEVTQYNQLADELRKALMYMV